MARFVFGMNQSLDGYVDHMAFAPDPVLFEHFVAQTRNLGGSIYGRRMYEIMRYWDEPSSDWGPAERDFADAWCRQPKYVVSRTLTEVGPNASLVSGDLETEMRRLKQELEGDIDVAGTQLAQALGEMGLVDAYRIYLHPVVLGGGTKFFAGALPRLRFEGSQEMSGGVVWLSYARA